MSIADYYSADKTAPMTNQEPDYYWSIPTADLFQRFNIITEEEREQKQEVGLTSAEANLRLTKYGKNLVEAKKKTDSLSLLISQFKSPIIVIFIFTSILSFFLGNHYYNRNCKRTAWILAGEGSYRCHY
jgi:magnesium-transporting ATPase (P-type)